MDEYPVARDELVRYFYDEAVELLGALDRDLLRLEAYVGRPADPEILAALFRGLHTIKGDAGMLEFVDVAGVAHALESAADLLRTGRLDVSAAVIQLLFEGRDVLTAAVQASVSGAPAPAALQPFLRRLSAGLGIPLAPEEPPQGPALEPPEPSAQARETPAAPIATRTETVRVDVERLDLLMNLVGELVINRTRISDIAGTLVRAVLDRADPDGLARLAKDLVESAALLARTTNDIQESIMKVRMIPIGTVFERFPRVVRDLARSRNKEVELLVEGAETDLDKTIVDHIGEPLLHLVRNCIDHGVEEPRVREACGKPRSGTIRLGAFHEGNQIIIEVQDDGAGIDLARIRARGIRLGLIGDGDALTERELMQLIFYPGFTTSEHVDDLSGRGVGMDVVKRTVLALKGSFEVDSTLGQGTKFTIKLPLTLAIIQALLVRVAAELYAIPLDAVIESQRLDTDEIREMSGGEEIMVRGSVIPLIRLDEFLGLGRGARGDKVMIVIVGIGGRQVGLVVDAFEGEQEIVIKPLSDILGRIPGVSGATILGNGSISLILDVHELVAAIYEGGPGARAEFSAV